MLRVRNKWGQAALVLLLGFFPASVACAADALGIDVSNNNETGTGKHLITESDWLDVASAGYTFAYVKATEGTGFEDSYEVLNMSYAADAGIKAGVYDFADPENATATAEANYFVNFAKDYISNGRLIPVLDLEQGGGATEDGGVNLSTWVNDYCAQVKSLTGIDPMIYCSTDFAENYLNSSVTVHKLWIANYGVNNGNMNVNPNNGSSVNGVWGTNWTAFQYTSVGSVNGIGGDVDLDEFNGSTAGLDTITIGDDGNNVSFATPEPTTLGLGLLTIAGLLRRRSRRCA